MDATGNKNRAGFYVTQPEGYASFIPKPLPPIPPIRMDNKMMNILSQADRALGRLDGAREILPNPELFVYMYVRKEAVLSSQIEGTQASLMDLLEYEADTILRGGPKDVKEVVNYIAAMNYGLEELKKGRKIDTSLLQNIHQQLLQNVRGSEKKPGELRMVQNWIGPSGSSIHDAIFIPPGIPDMKKSLLEFEDFITSKDEFPPLIKVGLAHVQFETIHPFLDGNGRIGRLLITYLLTVKGILRKPLLYLSYYLCKNRSEYYDRIQSVRDHGMWEEWLYFFLKGVSEVSNEATSTVSRIVKLMDESRKLIQTELSRSAGLGMDILDLLFQNPIISVKYLQDRLKCSYPHANRLISSFVELGILEELTGQKRNRRFVFRDYLNLF